MATHFRAKTEPKPLSERIARARQEGRTQQALELVRQFYKQQPTPEHKNLLSQVTMERGEHLARQGHLKDAIQVFTNALNLDDSLATKLDIARRLAVLGTLGPAVGLLRALKESPEKTCLLNAIVDGAMRQGAQGKAHLQPELHSAFDAIWQAFAHVEKGEEDAARSLLQNIGLQSPFMEWKVLLRGLMAYYAQDDLKARENWQRLDPLRTPFAIAGTFRVGIDPEFRKRQSPEQLKAVESVLDRTAPPGLTVSLRSLQKVFADPKRLADALRMADGILPAFKKEYPHLVPRLAHCFFWAIVDHGRPEDVRLFHRTFAGCVEDSPNFDRLQALATERRELEDMAHEAWLKYERHLAASASALPPGHADHMRALVWDHVGAMLMSVEARGFPEKLKPDAEACFKQSIQLLPNRLNPHRALFERFLDEPRGTTKAIRAGKTLLKHFPDHAATLEAMGDLELAKGSSKDSLEYYQRAMRANPLERRLRNKLGQAFFTKAMDLAIEHRVRKNRENVEDFRPHIEKALALVEGSKTHLLCRWSSLERRLGEDARAQQLEADALAVPHQRLAVRYALLCEAARERFKPAERKPLLDALLHEIQTQPTADEILALLETAALERVPRFVNQASIEKNARNALKKFDLNVFSEAQLESLCRALRRFDAVQLLEMAVKNACRRFKANPTFVLDGFDLQRIRFEKDHKRYRVFDMRRAVDLARSLTAKLPREQQESLAKEIQLREEILADFESDFVNPLFNLFGRLHDAFGGDDGYAEDDYDD